MVFRKMRESFNIDAGEYMLSLCSDASLRLLNTPGKSGAFFFLSQDDKVGEGSGTILNWEGFSFVIYLSCFLKDVSFVVYLYICSLTGNLCYSFL